MFPFGRALLQMAEALIGVFNVMGLVVAMSDAILRIRTQKKVLIFIERDAVHGIYRIRGRIVPQHFFRSNVIGSGASGVSSGEE